MKALGIDPGTSSFDICCLDDRTNQVTYEGSIPTSVVAKSPEKLFHAVREAEADVIVGPSAMGMPVTHISKITDLELAMATLGKNTEVDIAIRRFIRMLQGFNMNVFFVPSIIQLPTVPVHRKSNKVDMGTADKTCITALALWDHINRHGASYLDASFIAVELGFGFNAAMALEKGEIVDGIGGTCFPGPGYLTIGAMDLELIHTLGGFTEEQLGTGGIAYTLRDVISPEEYAERLAEEEFAVAWKGLVEGVVKAVAMELTVFKNKPREILLSGRITRVPRFETSLTKSLGRFGIPVRRIEGYAKRSKEAAQGAALVASGLDGGTYASLVQTLRLHEAKGSVLDYVRWPSFKPAEVICRKLQAMKM